MAPWLKYVLLGGVVFAALALLAAFAAMAFVFSIGTRVVRVKVETLVRDARGAPAPGCLVVFENSETAGMGRTAKRTGADGRVSHETTHSDVASLFWPFPREQDVALRLYLGEPPRYASYDETEVWVVSLKFRDPWRRGGTVQPAVSLKRGLFHEEVLFPPPGRTWQQAGTKALPGAPPGALSAGALRREREEGRDVYRVPLVIALDDAQLAACRAAPPTEPAAVADPASALERRANALFNERKWSEALAAYRDAATRYPQNAWAHLGAGDCLVNLERAKEAVPFYRRARELAPDDLEVRYAYANGLLWEDAAAAEAEFRHVVTAEPGKARGWIGLGNALYQLDRYREAVEAFGKAEALCGTCLSKEDRGVLADARKRARG